MPPRFGLQEVQPALETGAGNDAEAGETTTGEVASTAVSLQSVPTSTHGCSSIRITAHEARSSIQAGSSSHRPASPPSRLQRSTSPASFTTASWTCTTHPDQGCQGYRTSRSSASPVLWAFRRHVLQRRSVRTRLWKTCRRPASTRRRRVPCRSSCRSPTTRPRRPSARCAPTARSSGAAGSCPSPARWPARRWRSRRRRAATGWSASTPARSPRSTKHTFRPSRLDVRLPADTETEPDRQP